MPVAIGRAVAVQAVGKAGENSTAMQVVENSTAMNNTVSAGNQGYLLTCSIEVKNIAAQLH